MDEQITLDQVEMVEVDETEGKTGEIPIGDVTEAEKELILKEETLAGKIAAAESILKRERKQERLRRRRICLRRKIWGCHGKCRGTRDCGSKISEPIFQEAVFMEKQPETDEENENKREKGGEVPPFSISDKRKLLWIS